MFQTHILLVSIFLVFEVILNLGKAVTFLSYFHYKFVRILHRLTYDSVSFIFCFSSTIRLQVLGTTRHMHAIVQLLLPYIFHYHKTGGDRIILESHFYTRISGIN